MGIRLNMTTDLIINQNLDLFNASTIDPKNFKIYDVNGDNSCFYRCIVNILYTYFDENMINTILNINDNFKKFSFLDMDDEEIFSNEIRCFIANWIWENRYKYIDELDMYVKDLVLNTHPFLYDFINDFNHIDDSNSFIDLDEFLVNKYKEIYTNLYDNEFDKWGGAVEQYCISEIFEIPVNVYVFKKFNKNKNRIENGKIRNNKAERGVRFKLYQKFGSKYNNNNTIYLLYKNTKRCDGHYMLMFKNSD